MASPPQLQGRDSGHSRQIKIEQNEVDAIADRLEELKTLVPEGVVVELPKAKPDAGIDPNETSAWVWGWVH